MFHDGLLVYQMRPAKMAEMPFGMLTVMPEKPFLDEHLALMGVSLKHDGTDGSENTDGTAIERADGTANTGVN